MAIVFIGMETSGALRRRFQAQGHFTISADLLPAEDGSQYPERMEFPGPPIDPKTPQPQWLSHAGMAVSRPSGGHIQGDVFAVLEYLWARELWPDLAVFHPDCTYLTGCAAWAFRDADFDRFPGIGYHQRVKPATLVGEARRQARREAIDDVRRIMALPIRRKVIENPVGAIGTAIRPASQIIQPYEFGDDASKATCLWLLGKDNEELADMRLPIDPAKRVPGRTINGRERWGNQTDSGQNRLSPGAARWKDRSRTFPGIADAMVDKWGPLL